MKTRLRRDKEREERRGQILNAARTLMFEKGIASATMQRIATLGGMSVGTIYLYFESKEEVFAALQEEGLDLLGERITRAVESADGPEDGIRRMAGAYLAFSVENKKYFDIINYFLSAPDVLFPPRLKKRIDTHGNKILESVVKAVVAGTESGIFSRTDPRHAAVAFWGVLHGLIQFKKLKNTILRGDDLAEVYRSAVELYINGLRAKG
ncbi:MAG: TetR/AcrR family transcriptional regulator [Spirochaetes bacterium]|nr:MAG: TetR/AcrR family transcriptional regulator [Spirochaetota bacterium]